MLVSSYSLTVEKSAEVNYIRNMKIYAILICCTAMCTVINGYRQKKEWKEIDMSDPNRPINIGSYAVLVLDRPINLPKEYVANIWNKASYRAAADGGANRWYDFALQQNPAPQLTKTHPDLIVGELYQIKNEYLDLAKENNVTIVDNPDQNKTDITRGVEEIINQMTAKKRNIVDVFNIIAIAETSGRLDKIMVNLNAMYSSTQLFGNRHIRLYLLSTESLSWVLPPGLNELHIPQTLVQKEAKCGLIPVGAPATVTTSGLKWNLKNQTMQFGGLISTSNTYSASNEQHPVVKVETSSPLLWTMLIVVPNNTTIVAVPT